MKNVVFFCLLCGLFLTGCGKKSSDEDTGSADTGGSTTVAEARIFPDPAYASNRLEVKFDGVANIHDFTYVWKRNGQTIEGATENTLGPEHFRKGESISVEIHPKDGTGAPMTTPEVRVLNSPPTVMSASTFMGVRNGVEIFVHLRAHDVDDDDIQYSYHWYRNDQRLDNDGESLDPSLFERGDEVYAEIVASDGSSQSSPFKATAIKIDNHSPQIQSQPTTAVGEDRVFTYRVEATDPDGDDLSYNLLEAPTGMTITPEGELQWRVPDGDERWGTHKIRIQVSDPKGGAATQEFALTFSRQTQAAQQ